MTKIFYTNSGKLLGIDEANSPILLIKRDKNATAPRNLLERIRRYDYDDGEYNDDDYETEYGLGGSEGNTGDHHVEEDLESEGYEFPKHLDPEWYAFEVWQEPVDDPDNDPDDGEDDEDDRNELNQAPAYSSNKYENKLDSVQPKLSQLTLQESSLTHHGTGDELTSTLHLSNITVKSSLSLLECLLRLSCLQNYQQCSHLSVSDELLNLYLQDGNSWLGSQETREREREYAKQRIGFDPFASPQSGEEEVRGVTGTPRQTERINRISNSQTRSPIARSPIRHPVPRGRVLLPITPKNPASTRSDSPGAQLRLESASKSDKNNAISRSYPSTPVPLSKIDGRHESGDSISSRKWGDYIGDNQHNSVKRNEQASWLRR